MKHENRLCMENYVLNQKFLDIYNFNCMHQQQNSFVDLGNGFKV